MVVGHFNTAFLGGLVMNNDNLKAHALPGQPDGDDGKQDWVKPEVAVAKVQEATQSGAGSPTISDLGTCAS